MRPPSLLLLAALMGCGLAVPEDAVEGRVGEPFELAVGQVGVVDEAGLVIQLQEVTEDSRCPVDAVCIWAGNGRATLRLRGPGPERLVALNTFVQPRTMPFGDFELALHDLLPEARSDVVIPPGAYRASLLVTRR